MLTAYDVRLRMGLPLTAFHRGDDSAYDALISDSRERVEQLRHGNLFLVEKALEREIAREPSCDR